MLRRLVLLAGLAALGAVAWGDDKPSPVPKDSLPAKIPIDVIPLGLKDREVPKDNPLTEERVRLGRRLFFDPILSSDNTVACASCHEPTHGFAGSDGKARGIRGQR